MILERLEGIDEAAHFLSYALLSDTPFGNCLTTMTLHALGPQQAELIWSANFHPARLPVNEAVALIGCMLVNNYQALKRLFES